MSSPGRLSTSTCASKKQLEQGVSHAGLLLSLPRATPASPMVLGSQRLALSSAPATQPGPRLLTVSLPPRRLSAVIGLGNIHRVTPLRVSASPTVGRATHPWPRVAAGACCPVSPPLPGAPGCVLSQHWPLSSRNPAVIPGSSLSILFHVQSVCRQLLSMAPSIHVQNPASLSTCTAATLLTVTSRCPPSGHGQLAERDTHVGCWGTRENRVASVSSVTLRLKPASLTRMREPSVRWLLLLSPSSLGQAVRLSWERTEAAPGSLTSNLFKKIF